MSSDGNVWIALLRGVNVGGRNRLPMETLRVQFEQLGCNDVRSWIQSGNVVFRADDELAARIPAELERRLVEELEVRSPVVVRSRRRMAAIVRSNPWPEADPGHLHVAYLADQPADDRVAALAPDRSPGDRFHVAGAEIYLHLPNGVARTKLTNAWFDRQLDTVATVRNWKTTGKLLEMADALD